MRHLGRGWDEVVGEGDRKRLAALVVEEFLEERAAEPLGRSLTVEDFNKQVSPYPFA